MSWWTCKPCDVMWVADARDPCWVCDATEAVQMVMRGPTSTSAFTVIRALESTQQESAPPGLAEIA